MKMGSRIRKAFLTIIIAGAAFGTLNAGAQSSSTVYMSTKGMDRFPFQFSLAIGTDWYAMRTDGSEVKRLTTMNVNRNDKPENADKMQVACTVAVSPSGDLMLGGVQDSIANGPDSYCALHLPAPFVICYDPDRLPS